VETPCSLYKAGQNKTTVRNSTSSTPHIIKPDRLSSIESAGDTPLSGVQNGLARHSSRIHSLRTAGAIPFPDWMAVISKRRAADYLGDAGCHDCVPPWIGLR
jgi:hypothetical protein